MELLEPMEGIRMSSFKERMLAKSKKKPEAKPNTPIPKLHSQIPSPKPPRKKRGSKKKEPKKSVTVIEETGPDELFGFTESFQLNENRVKIIKLLLAETTRKKFRSDLNRFSEDLMELAIMLKRKETYEYLYSQGLIGKDKYGQYEILKR